MTKRRRILIASVILLVGFLASLGVRELPGVIYPMIWRCLGVQCAPPGVPFYNVHVSNATGQPLAITVVLINDRTFAPPSAWQERFNLRTGWRWNKDMIIATDDSMTIRLPSPVDPRLGIVMVVGRTPLLTDRPYLRQGMCMRFLTWPWQNGSHSWRNTNGEWPLLQCAFDAQDLQWLEHTGGSGTPMVPALKSILERQLGLF